MQDYPIPVPAKSRQAFWSHKGKPFQNAGLIFERFSPDTQDDSKIKEKGLQAVLDAFGRADTKLLEEWNTRWEKLVRSAGAEPFPMKTDWRLIAGLGKKGSLEVGFTFHRYGFPYLPGSSLKGLARAYGLLEVAEKIGGEILNKVGGEKPLTKLDETLSLDEEKKFKEGMNDYGMSRGSPVLEIAESFRYVFGTTEQAGKAIFFDAIPSDKPLPRLELDIINPHYPDYYKEGSNEYPTNWQSPIPVKFLTVASGTIFRFAIGWRNSPEDSKDNSEKKQQPHTWSWFKGERLKIKTNTAPESQPRMQKLARRWLQGGLLDLGAGGKTSAGYGYFKE